MSRNEWVSDDEYYGNPDEIQMRGRRGRQQLHRIKTKRKLARRKLKRHAKAREHSQNIGLIQDNW